VEKRDAGEGVLFLVCACACEAEDSDGWREREKGDGDPMVRRPKLIGNRREEGKFGLLFSLPFACARVPSLPSFVRFAWGEFF